MPKRVKPANELSDTDAAYLAGFVDGEGCYVTACLEVSNVNRKLLESLKGMVGTGNICSKKRRRKKAKILHVWHIHMGALPTLLPQLIPYLLLKRTQAELMLELVRYSKCPSVLNPDDRFQLSAIGQLNRLNQRGELAFSN